MRKLSCKARLRADKEARTISGVAVPYSQVAPSYKERIEPGAFANLPERLLVTLQHDRAKPLGFATLEDTPTELRFSVVLPPGQRQDQALADVESGLLDGASVEYLATDETPIDGVYSVRAGELIRMSIVDDPAFPDATLNRADTDGNEARNDLPVFWQ